MDIEGRKEVKDEKGAERDEKEQRKGVKTLKEMFEIRGGRAKNKKLRKNTSSQEKDRESEKVGKMGKLGEMEREMVKSSKQPSITELQGGISSNKMTKQGNNPKKLTFNSSGADDCGKIKVGGGKGTGNSKIFREKTGRFGDIRQFFDRFSPRKTENKENSEKEGGGAKSTPQKNHF